MRLELKTIWKQIRELSTEKVANEFENIAQWWNEHDNGSRAWSNVNSINSSTQSINQTFLGLGHNRIINGDMQIDQRNEGALVTVNSPTLTYGADRFWGSGTAAAGVFKTQRISTTPPTGFSFYTHLTVTSQDASIAAGDIYVLGTVVEGYNIRDFLFGSTSAIQCTLSFYVRSSLTGTFSGSITNGAGNRSYPFTYTIVTASTWERKSITLTGDQTGAWPKANENGMTIYWDLGTGSTYQGTANTWAATLYLAVAGSQQVITSTSNTWDITGVQLEVGPMVSSYEFVPMPILLHQCQRYYEKSYDSGIVPGTNTLTSIFTIASNLIGAGTTAAFHQFSVDKRTTPTVVNYDRVGASGKISTITAAAVIANNVAPATATAAFNSFAVTQSTTSTATYIQYQYTADADF